MKKHFRKIASLILCTAILLSSAVFAFPTASAATVSVDTAQYRVRILMIEGNSFDNSIHNDVSYVPGICYGEDSKRNLNGTSKSDDNGNYWCEYAKITYKKFNGTGEEGTVWFNVGDEDDYGRTNVISSWTDNHGYFPGSDGVVIDGFPTSATVRYYNTKSDGNKGSYSFYLQVATWNSTSSSWDWTNNYADGGVNNYGTSTKKAVVGIGLDSLPAENKGGVAYGVCKEHKFNEDQEFKTTVDVPDAAYPAAQVSSAAASYNLTELDVPASTAAGKKSATLSFSDIKDQYGSKMAYNILVSSSESGENGITQDGKTTYIDYGANIAKAGVNEQNVNALVDWHQKVSSSGVSATASFKTKDAVYPVKWQNYLGNEIASETYSFGETPSYAVPSRNFDSDYHYTNATWNHSYEAVTDKSNNVYTASYTALPHSFSASSYVNEAYHLSECSVAGETHYERMPHVFTCEVIAPTCTATGCTRYTCSDCGYSYDTNITSIVPHTWDKGTITVQPDCENSGVITYKCVNCTQTKIDHLGALGHIIKLKTFAPTDKESGSICYYCERCNSSFWAAVEDDENGGYTMPDETEYKSAEMAAKVSGTSIPAPSFNIFTDTSINYSYDKRGASLKYIHTKTPDYQPLRFTASVLVPEKVDFRVGSEGNAITDFGFVFSLSENIDTADDLVLGADDVYSMSVKEKNTGVYNGLNWGGVSKHDTDEGTQLTYNLVVKVKPENWAKNYCARAYITYNYRGIEYTVYDAQYSERSVEYVANCIIASSAEKQQAKDYCQSVILDNM